MKKEKTINIVIIIMLIIATGLAGSSIYFLKVTKEIAHIPFATFAETTSKTIDVMEFNLCARYETSILGKEIAEKYTKSTNASYNTIIAENEKNSQEASNNFFERIAELREQGGSK